MELPLSAALNADTPWLDQRVYFFAVFFGLCLRHAFDRSSDCDRKDAVQGLPFGHPVFRFFLLLFATGENLPELTKLGCSRQSARSSPLVMKGAPFVVVSESGL